MQQQKRSRMDLILRQPPKPPHIYFKRLNPKEKKKEKNAF